MPCVLFCYTPLCSPFSALFLCVRLLPSAWHTNQKSMAQRVGQLGSSTKGTTTINVAIKCSHWTRMKLQIVAFPLSDCPNKLKSCNSTKGQQTMRCLPSIILPLLSCCLIIAFPFACANQKFYIGSWYLWLGKYLEINVFTSNGTLWFYSHYFIVHRQSRRKTISIGKVLREGKL